MDHIRALPRPILNLILIHLDFDSIQSLSKTGSYLQPIASSDRFWDFYLQHRYPKISRCLSKNHNTKREIVEALDHRWFWCLLLSYSMVIMEGRRNKDEVSGMISGVLDLNDTDMKLLIFKPNGKVKAIIPDPKREFRFLEKKYRVPNNDDFIMDSSKDIYALARYCELDTDYFFVNINENFMKGYKSVHQFFIEMRDVVFMKIGCSPRHENQVNSYV